MLLLQLQQDGLFCIFWIRNGANYLSFFVLLLSQTQFVEIKGSVFKKFGKNNLFQMSNSGKIFKITDWINDYVLKRLREQKNILICFHLLAS